MRKALRRAGMTMTAGLLGLASPALAQYAAHPAGTSGSMVKPVPAPASYFTADAKSGDLITPASHTSEVISSVAGAPVSYVIQTADGQAPAPLLEGHSRLEEMKVELALLGDPTTFPYHLAAHVEGPSLQVRGFVPNDAVRKRTLELARTSTVLTVADGLKIHPKLSMRIAGEPPETLEKGAIKLLTANFPEAVEGIEVKAKVNGQVILTGSIRSYEEKLLVSRLMRRLTGCTSVVNQLKVIPVVRDGSSLTMVTADGLHLVPNEIADESAVEMPARLPMTAPKPLTLPALPAVNVTPKQPPTTVVPWNKSSPMIDPLEVPPVKPVLPQAAPTDRRTGVMTPPTNSKLPPMVGESGTVTTGVISFISPEPETPAPPGDKP